VSPGVFGGRSSHIRCGYKLALHELGAVSDESKSGDTTREA
jgi:hypothetical protein